MGGMNPENEHPLNALTEQASAEERKKTMGTEKAVRTLEGDIREAVEERNASTASMVIAERTKTAAASEHSQPASNAGKKLFIVLASIILVVLGAGGGYYLYLQSPLAPRLQLRKKRLRSRASSCQTPKRPSTSPALDQQPCKRR